MKTICYPHAYGNLDARASNLVEKFAIDCHWNGVEASEEQLSILKKLVDEMRDEAYEQALEHDEQGGCEAPSKQSSGSYTGSIVGFSGL